MTRLMKAITACNLRIDEIERRVGPCFTKDVDDELEAAMLEDEIETRKFLTSCTPKEFENSAIAFLDCAYKFGLPFVEFLEAQAELKGWTDYLRDMIGEARMEVETKTASPA